MELGHVTHERISESITRACIALSTGVWLASLLYVVVRNPWAGVLACGSVLGFVLCEWWSTVCELRDRQEEVVELEKQVVVLKSAMQEMAVLDSVSEGRMRRAQFRAAGRALSASSL